MICEIRWIASFSASCMYANEMLLRGWPVAARDLAEALAAPAHSVAELVDQLPQNNSRFRRALCAFAHQIESNRELVETAARKSGISLAGCQPVIAALTGQITEFERAVRQVVPGMTDELALRGKPLRELWEARGPGLLRSVGRLTEERLVPASAEVVLVYPILGGGGTAYLVNNSVQFEAVLTNNVPELPEIVRLGWLLAQLNQDLPVFSEGLPSELLPTLAELALLPAVLTAAQEVELAACDLGTVMTALTAWRMRREPDEALAHTLLAWWQTYLESRPPWSTALAALHQMVTNGEAAPS